MEYSCLIVDDEEMIAQSTCEYFNLFDVDSRYVTSYEACLEFLKENKVSLLLIDINLGGRSGFELCKNLRRSMSLPILFISARNSDDDILTALNIGGDDYITKPFSLNILLAKVKAILRRLEHTTAPPPSAAAVNAAADNPGESPLALDDNYRQVIVEGIPVRLKDMEYRLLKYLMENQGRIVTKEELFENVWEDSYVGEGTLSVHIRHLRRKIERNPDAPQYIKTQWGVGYLFEGGSL